MRTNAGRFGPLLFVLLLAIPAFPSEGIQSVWSVTTFGGGDGFVDPSDIEIDTARSLIYVVDAGSARILVFDFHGKFVRAIGTKGQGPGEFARPTGAALVPGGGLAVADFGSRRIQIFDAAGKFVRTITPTEARVADLVLSEGRFYSIPVFGASGYSVTMDAEDRSQPLVNVLDEQGKKVLEMIVSDFPEKHPFVRAIKHRVVLTLSPGGRLYLPYFAANLVHVFEKNGQKAGEFSRPLPFRPITPALLEQRSSEGIVQMRASNDAVSVAASFGPDGRLYILTATESLVERLKKPENLRGPAPMRLDVVDPESFRLLRTLLCDPGVRAFGLLDRERLAYIYEDGEGELTLKCVRY